VHDGQTVDSLTFIPPEERAMEGLAKAISGAARPGRYVSKHPLTVVGYTALRVYLKRRILCYNHLFAFGKGRSRWTRA